MKTLALLLVGLVACFGLVGCDNWKTTTTPAFSVSLPDTPQKQTTSIGGIGSADVYVLNVKDQGIVTVGVSDAWPSMLDANFVYMTLWPFIVGNMGSKTATDLTSINGFTAKEFLTDNGKTAVRIYLNKPAIRYVKIDNQTTALNKDFVKKVFDGFKPTMLQK